MKRVSYLVVIFLSLSWTIFPVNISVALNKEFMYDNADERDPFISLIAGDVKFADMKDIEVGNLALEGIIFDPLQGSFAIINGEVYRVADFVSGFEIKEVAEDHIKVQKNDVLYTVKLPSDEQKNDENKPGKDSHETL